MSRLRIAFKWMVRAFSGYLSTDQLLLLWDRILGYDSLEIVAGGFYGSVPALRYVCVIVALFLNVGSGETKGEIDSFGS